LEEQKQRKENEFHHHRLVIVGIITVVARVAFVAKAGFGAHSL
jgi:hypothetical protein